VSALFTRSSALPLKSSGSKRSPFFQIFNDGHLILKRLADARVGGRSESRTRHRDPCTSVGKPTAPAHQLVQLPFAGQPNPVARDVKAGEARSCLPARGQLTIHGQSLVNCIGLKPAESVPPANWLNSIRIWWASCGNDHVPANLTPGVPSERNYVN
jgi:hypothetical protein